LGINTYSYTYSHNKTKADPLSDQPESVKKLAKRDRHVATLLATLVVSDSEHQ